MRKAGAFEVAGKTGYKQVYSSREHFEEVLEKRNFPKKSSKIIAKMFKKDPTLGFNYTLDVQLLRRLGFKSEEGPDYFWYFTSKRFPSGQPFEAEEEIIHCIVSYNVKVLYGQLLVVPQSINIEYPE